MVLELGRGGEIPSFALGNLSVLSMMDRTWKLDAARHLG